MLFRFKIARRQRAERNRPDVIQKRHDYANWFMGQAIVSHTVFVDECGYNIWTARSQGRAIRGERAYRQVCGRRGRNLTVAFAISPTAGLVFHSAIIGRMNARKFADFLAQTRLHLDPDEQVVFIYDDAPAHHNPGNPGPNTKLKKLPLYSPFLNIVEQAISLLKASIKADISRPEIQREINNRDEARRQGSPLGHYRTQLLMEALHSNAGTITVAKCTQWFRFMQTYLLRSINREVIEVNVVLVRTFFHEQVKRHRLTFFSYHLFKTCNLCPVTQENVTFSIMLLYSHNRLSMFMTIAQLNFLFFMNACQ